MRRDLFTDEHELFRAQFRRFAEREIEPRIAHWNRDRITDRDTWRRMGAEGFLGPALPEAYGGGGGDFLFDAIVMEELARRRAHGLLTAVPPSLPRSVCRTCCPTAARSRSDAGFRPRSGARPWSASA